MSKKKKYLKSVTMKKIWLYFIHIHLRNSFNGRVWQSFNCFEPESKWMKMYLLSINKRIWIWIDQNIGDSEATVVCKALKSNSTLTKLDMSCYEMKEVDV